MSEPEYKQYVNLDPTKPDQLGELKPRRAGRAIKIRSTVTPKTAGIPVYFQMEAGANNVRSSRPTKLIALTDDEGKADVSFTLSTYGGDEFKISSYLIRADGSMEHLGSAKYVVWRRIYYQCSRFKGGPKGAGRTGTLPEIPALAMGPVEKELMDRRHNIELVDDSSKPLIDRYCNVLEDDEHYRASAVDGYDRKREPVAMRVVLVNQIAKMKTERIKFDAVMEWKPIKQSLPPGHTLWVDESLPADEDWLVDAEWRWQSGDLLWERLDRKLVHAVGINAIEIRLGSMPHRFLGIDQFLGRVIEVRVTYRYTSNFTNGVSWYNAIWIAHESMHRGVRPDRGKQATIIHETGHFIGMVPPRQSTHYTKHGHQGPHCSTGLSGSNLTRISYVGLGGTCVMFGESGTLRKDAFCSACDLSVRTRSAIVNGTMPWL